VCGPTYTASGLSTGGHTFTAQAIDQAGNLGTWTATFRRRAKLIVPTALGLDEMTRSDAIMAAIERRHAEALGDQAYTEFKRAFRQVCHHQRDAET
jgi:hypothetical protein